MFDVGPGGDNRTKHHQAKREKRKTGHRATEPQHFSVGNEDDGQVLENGVDRDRQELERLRTGVNHTDQEQSDRKPYIVGSCKMTASFISASSRNVAAEKGHIHFLASSALKSR